MKLCVSSEWLWEAIQNDEDIETEAGRLIHRSSDVVKAMHAAERLVQEEPEQAAQAHEPRHLDHVMGRFVHMARLKDKLTPAQLAERIRVDAEEIVSLEINPDFQPRNRTVHQLAQYVNVPSSTLLSLTPKGRKEDAVLNEEALRFAASSTNLESLSRAERKLFNEFVKFLSEHKKSKTPDGKQRA